MHVGGQLVKVVWRQWLCTCKRAVKHRLASPSADENISSAYYPARRINVEHRVIWVVLDVYWKGRGKLTRNIYPQASILCKVPGPPGSITALRRYFCNNGLVKLTSDFPTPIRLLHRCLTTLSVATAAVLPGCIYIVACLLHVHFCVLSLNSLFARRRKLL